MSLAFPLASVVFTGISALIAFLVPIVLAVLCCRRSRNGLLAISVGAVSFIVGAMLLESLVHQLVFSLVPGIAQNVVLFSLYGCLMAGLFEETARLVGLHYLCKKDPSPTTGFAYGVGHGGIEAILLVGVSVANNLVIMIMVNGGSLDALLEGATDDQVSTAMTQLEQLAAQPSPVFLSAGVERIVSICLHLALSVLIWMVVTKKLPMWGYPLAIGLHAVSNIAAALYQYGAIGIWTSEAITAVITLCICLLVRQFYRSRVSAAA